MVDQPKFIAPTPTPIIFAGKAISSAEVGRHPAARLAAVPDPGTEPELDGTILAEGEIAPDIYPEITHIGGVEIIERELAIGPHPRTKKPATYKTVMRVLLADSQILLVCPWIDEDGHQCGYVGETVAGVNSHRTTKHLRPAGWRRYSDETLKAVMRAVAEAKSSKAKDYMTRAAMILNGRGLKTVNDVEWTPEAVSHIWGRYHEEFPVRAPRRPKAGTPASAPTSGAGVTRVTKKAGSGALDGLLTVAEMLVQEIRDLQAGGLGEPDPKVLAKAAAWDQMQANLQALRD